MPNRNCHFNSARGTRILPLQCLWQTTPMLVPVLKSCSLQHSTAELHPFRMSATTLASIGTISHSSLPFRPHYIHASFAPSGFGLTKLRGIETVLLQSPPTQAVKMKLTKSIVRKRIPSQLPVGRNEGPPPFSHGHFQCSCLGRL